MKETLHLNLIYEILVLTAIMTLPINFHFSTIATICLFILSIINFKDINFVFIKNHLSPLFLFFIMVIIMTFIHNDSIKTIEKYTSFFIFPIIVSNRLFYKIPLKKLLLSFIVGCVVTYFISLIYPFLYKFSFSSFTFTPIDISLIEIKSLNWLNYFISVSFTKTTMSRAYFALYFNFAFFLGLYYKSIFTNKIVYKVVMLILFLGIIQSYSITGYIAFVSALIYYLFRQRKSYLFIIFFFLGIFFYINVRIGDLFFEITSLFSGNLNPELFGYRLMIWLGAINIFAKNFIYGVGADQAQHLLNLYIDSKTNWGMDWLQNKAIYNTHNQFFQILIEYGLIGFIFFILSILYLVYNGKKNKLLMVFIILIITHLFTESMFHRYWGISFYCLFYSIYARFQYR